MGCNQPDLAVVIDSGIVCEPPRSRVRQWRRTRRVFCRCRFSRQPLKYTRVNAGGLTGRRLART